MYYNEKKYERIRKQRKNKYRKAYKSTLKKEYYNKKKIHGTGPYFPTCSCCNNDYGYIHSKDHKKKMHRHIRRTMNQEVYEEIRMILEEIYL